MGPIPFGEKDLAGPPTAPGTAAQMATGMGPGHLRRVGPASDGDAAIASASAKRYELSAESCAGAGPVLGIGAVFTPDPLRGHGHARAPDRFDDAGRRAHRGCRYALLFSEIGAAYYESMGFRTCRARCSRSTSCANPARRRRSCDRVRLSDLTVIADINRRYRDRRRICARSIAGIDRVQLHPAAAARRTWAAPAAASSNSS